MAKIGVVLHGEDEAAQHHARALGVSLRDAGHDVVGVDVDVAQVGIPPVSETEFADGLDLVVSLGGDGTMLHAVGLLHGADVKILGVNFGDLGYLTVVDPHDLDWAVERALGGDHGIEERMLVRGMIGDLALDALNDIVVERAPGETTIRLGVAIDGERFTSYPADGLIVATPTGSTAYALSARGPIVLPNHHSLQLTPVSPHMLFDRTVVAGPECVIELTVEGHRPAAVSVDGRSLVTMEPGQTIHCTRSPRVARLVTFGERDHLAVLKSKLGLADR